MMLVMIIIVAPSFGTSLDSLRTEQIEGKLFVIHQVDEGETLYAIARRYKISVPTIISYNQSAQLDLKIGTLIKIPLANPIAKIDTIGMSTHLVETKETLFSISREYSVSVADIKSWNNLVSNELNIGQELYLKISSEVKVIALPMDADNKTTHVLQQGETLYSLSKQYGVEIDQIKSWNKLEDNTLSIGQLLIVSKKNTTVSENLSTTQAKDPALTIDSVKVKPTESTSNADTIQTSKRVENIHGFDEVMESGIGELIPGSTESRKYLGLHRTAKIGTIMKVRNEMNNKMVFVRIIGRIPNTGDNKKVLLKISKAAYDRLSIIDPRFRIEISYMP
jgi:LysM repeat protein